MQVSITLDSACITQISCIVFVNFRMYEKPPKNVIRINMYNSLEEDLLCLEQLK